MNDAITWSDLPPANPHHGAVWIDSHVHLDTFDRADAVDLLVERANAAGVRQMVAIGGSDEANERALRLARAFAGSVFAVAGFDRDKAGTANDIAAVRAMVAAAPDLVVGIGESGLDYHYEPEAAPQQRALFAQMLDLAAETARPIVVHSREADDDTLDLLRAYVRNWPADPGRPGVLHCFTGTYDFARKLLDLGFLISFSGILTFRNADPLRECARKLPLDRILIETDAPYLAPVPHRGKTNEPGWVVKVAETLASTRGDALHIVAEQTTGNSRFLFQLPKETTT
ncbi:MAG TPA: TatD family hydrolase [Kiritimatiellia bacterium]|nr:TatD family hydrolase [Kiritimatiellia bacterium]HMP32877.1 TatD family hydrolase [Kiritimatiellia bacterium]